MCCCCWFMQDLFKWKISKYLNMNVYIQIKKNTSIFNPNAEQLKQFICIKPQSQAYTACTECIKHSGLNVDSYLASGVEWNTKLELN